MSIKGKGVVLESQQDSAGHRGSFTDARVKFMSKACSPRQHHINSLPERAGDSWPTEQRRVTTKAVSHGCL